MSMDMYPQSTNEIEDRRRTLAPQQLKAFHEFSRQVFAEGALGAKVKQLVAVAVAHTTQCPYCIRGHTAGALKAGASPEEIMETIWVVAEMRAGAAYAHSTIALDAMQAYAEKQG
jgi:AhpD family alkylhydroperoxidase